MMLHTRTLSLAFVFLVLAALVAEACNVPVFRFALERWRADAYRVTVVHQGPLSAEEKQLLAQLEEQHDKRLANVAVRAIDVDDLEDADKQLVAGRDDVKLPLLVVQYPEALQIPAPIWSQPFGEPAVKSLVDSPLRKDLLNRLLDGETAVWLLLESGDQTKDDEAAKLLETELAKLAKDLKLPELTDLPDDELFAKTPLKLSFSMLRVPRSEAESPLVQMLVRCESDLAERNDPMIFPVFGRGRALLPLIGAGITADNIKSSASFLVGACSCEVKELNPGFDLLLAADWDELLSIDGKPLPIVPTRSLPDAPAELVPIPQGSNSAPAVIAATSTAAPPVATAPATAAQPKSNAFLYTAVAIIGALVTLVVLVNLNQKPA